MALRRAGRDTSREGLVNGLEAMRDVDLGGFFIDFSPKKHTGSSFVELTVLTQDGKVRR